jgi:hypothetical protein
MPPSSAGTIRSNPGQAEGRKAVDIGRSFKEWTGWLAALWWAKGRHYACFARAHENACRSDSAFQVIRKRNERPAPWVTLFT